MIEFTFLLAVNNDGFEGGGGDGIG